MNSRLEELWGIVLSIPYGKCASYGQVGRALTNPVSGFLVGKWMAMAPEGVPWWRVVGKEGDLLLSKSDPALAEKQRKLLLDEGTRFEGERVDMTVSGHELL